MAKTTFYLIRIFFFHFFIFSSNISIAQSYSAEQIYSKINNAVVKIYSVDEDGEILKQGSGVVLNDRGWLLTNYHVYEGGSKLIIQFKGSIVPALETLFKSKEKDILILKISGHFPNVQIGKSSSVKIGQKIFTIGSPKGFENTIAEGIISGLRTFDSGTKSLFQISAPISSGSSGGAVINSKGELIGITNASAEGQNINFAIPIEEFIKLGNKVRQYPIPSNSSVENEGLYPVKIENKYGFINNKGVVVVQPNFDFAWEFSNKLARVSVGRKIGFINNKGEFIITPRFDDVEDFEEGMAKIKISGKYGYINKKGSIILKPVFKVAYSFHDGLAYVVESLADGHESKGFIDKLGKFKMSFSYIESGFFSEGKAIYAVDQRCGFFDLTGTILTRPLYSGVLNFNEGVAWVCKSPQGDGPVYSMLATAKWGCIDSLGEFTIPLQNFAWVNNFSEGLSAVRLVDESYSLSDYCFINKKGEVVIPPQFENCGYFKEGLASVKLHGKWGYINTKGELVIRPVLDYGSDFKDGIAKIKYDGLVYYINKSGKFIWNPNKININLVH